MSDLYCPFCGTEGFAKENRGTMHEDKNGNCSSMWGISFLEHESKCPFRGLNGRFDYLSKQEAVDSYKNGVVLCRK